MKRYPIKPPKPREPITDEEIEELYRKAEEKYGNEKLRKIFHVKNESEDFYIVVSRSREPRKSFMEFLKDYIESGDYRKGYLRSSEVKTLIEQYLDTARFKWYNWFYLSGIHQYQRFEVNPYPDEQPELVEKWIN